MGKEYNNQHSKFKQAHFEKVAQYLAPELQSAFKKGWIDLNWCKCYCVPYILSMFEENS